MPLLGQGEQVKLPHIAALSQFCLLPYNFETKSVSLFLISDDLLKIGAYFLVLTHGHFSLQSEKRHADNDRHNRPQTEPR